MIPPAVEYRRADSVAEAVDLLADNREADPELLAGGQGLVPAMKRRDRRPGLLVDVGGIDDLREIATDGGDGEGETTVQIGALATLTDVAASETVRGAVPALAEAAGRAADRQIRNRATLGGNLVEAATGADPPAVALATGARLTVRGPDGERTRPVERLYDGEGLSVADVVTRVTVDRTGGAYVRRTHPTSGYATVGVAAVATVADDAVADPRVAATGIAERPVRLPAVEDTVDGATVGRDDGHGDDDADDRGSGGDGEVSGSTGDGAATDGLEPIPATERGLDAATERAVAEAAARAGEGVAAPPHGDREAAAQFRRTILERYVRRALGTALERETR